MGRPGFTPARPGLTLVHCVFGLQLRAPITLPDCQRVVMPFRNQDMKPRYINVQPVTRQQVPGDYGPGFEKIGAGASQSANLPTQVFGTFHAL